MLRQLMGLLEMTFCEVEPRDNSTDGDRLSIEHMKETAGYITTALCLIGIGGNILNLKTLQTSSLQTVPFMYIRALAVFDIIGLLGVLGHSNSKQMLPEVYIKYFYKAHIEAVVINTFFIGGLYCAFMLTIERYRLITNPHHCRPSKPKQVARWRILLALFLAFLLHLPLSVQFIPNRTKNGGYSVGNNIQLLCRTNPLYTKLFTYYKLARELLRLTTVVCMTVLNIIIARRLQETKRRRREMILRSTSSASAILGASNSNRSSLAASMDNLQWREWLHNFKSFTEKKLTVLMFGICVIYLVGNVPQILIMVLQDESKERSYSFQFYRQIGNTLEVLNHCMNFYVFCMASAEYSRAFLLNCRCLRRFFARIPYMKRITSGPSLHGVSVASVGVRDVNPVELRDMSSSSGGRKISTIPNESALTSSQEDNSRRKSSEPWFMVRKDTTASQDTQSLIRLEEEMLILVGNKMAEEDERKPLRSILVTPARRQSLGLCRPLQKKSLTIVNDEREESDDEKESPPSAAAGPPLSEGVQPVTHHV